MDAGSNCCNLPLKSTEEDRDETQEVTVSLAAAKEISLDAAAAAVLSGCFFSVAKTFSLYYHLTLATRWNVTARHRAVAHLYCRR